MRAGYAVVATSRSIEPSGRIPASSPSTATSPTPTPPTGWSSRRSTGSGGSTRWSTTPGSSSPSRSPTTPRTTSHAITAVNLAGFFHVTQRVDPPDAHAGRRPRRQHHDDPRRPRRRSGAPSALASLTKGGLAAVTRSLAIEYADRGIRVNAVAPGVDQDADARPSNTTPPRRATPARPDGRGRATSSSGPVPRTGDVRHRRDPAHRRRPGRRPLKRTTTIPQQISRPLAQARKPRDSSREPIVRWDGDSWAKAPGGRLPGRRRCVTVPSLVREGGKAWLS